MQFFTLEIFKKKENYNFSLASLLYKKIGDVLHRNLGINSLNL